MTVRYATLAAFAVTALSSTAVFAEDQIKIVGSSTVFPFATTVAERFGKNTEFKTPVVESTGSGGGLKLFCACGVDAPYVTNASRRIYPGRTGHAKRRRNRQCRKRGGAERCHRRKCPKRG